MNNVRWDNPTSKHHGRYQRVCNRSFVLLFVALVAAYVIHKFTWGEIFVFALFGIAWVVCSVLALWVIAITLVGVLIPAMESVARGLVAVWFWARGY